MAWFLCDISPAGYYPAAAAYSLVFRGTAARGPERQGNQAEARPPGLQQIEGLPWRPFRVDALDLAVALALAS